ncbi:MAG: tetratricopeptide repeat protein [Candidatus Melainabacteria bacterium]|nr:tetratricopeptide repeat protein [Candidatus Melainabacteria bacterium]
MLSSLCACSHSSDHLKDSFESACNHISKKEFALAHKHLHKLAKSKHPKALTIMGIFHEKGVVVERDVSKAMDYYKQAAQQGLPEAQSRLGHLLLETAGKNSGEAIAWLEKAAAQGEATAQATLRKLDRSGQMNGALNNMENGMHQGGAQYKSGMDNLTKSWVGYADIVNTLNEAAAASSSANQKH